MPQPYKRVRLDNGVEKSVRNVRDGMQVIDREAVDVRGNPLPMSRPVVDEDRSYASQSVADLRAEVDRRNQGRAEDDLIVVRGKGNKPDVVKALEADDKKQPAPPATTSGDSAALTSEEDSK